MPSSYSGNNDPPPPSPHFLLFVSSGGDTDLHAPDSGVAMATEDPNGEGDGLDCYPYGFSPLLLFSQGDYFDKGHSNYNSVAQFFSSAVDLKHGVNMLENVLFDRKNMFYEALLEHVKERNMLVICCIESHFTGFQIMPNNGLIYYDPLKDRLSYVAPGDNFNKFVLWHLLKCKYGDSQHIQENQDHYVGKKTNAVRRAIYALWKDINNTDSPPYGVRSSGAYLNVDKYMFINNARDPRLMSTQLTGCTCYFQTYLFGVLCKVCSPSLSGNGSNVNLQNLDVLEAVTIDMCRFLLEFFVEAQAQEGYGTGTMNIMRPLTNSNFVLDFFRYKDPSSAAYYVAASTYLRGKVDIPNYDRQYEEVHHLSNTIFLTLSPWHDLSTISF
jgi:hypothetical protein